MKETATATPLRSEIVDWQNHPHDPQVRDTLATLVRNCGRTAHDELARGMVIAGTTAEQVVEDFTGHVTIALASFSRSDAVADEFAKMDLRVADSEVRVKLWTIGAHGLPLPVADSGFTFEQEWVVAGDFTAEAEMIDAHTVAVNLFPIPD